MKYKISDEKDLIRLDKYLIKKTDISRSKIQQMIKEKLILLNGKQAKNSYVLKLNDEIEVVGELSKKPKLNRKKWI